ncbi:Hypothetical protein Nlim_0790 [Candidatus Nitrosarchaeum limnium SFB1]|uniref:Uncharacterized protein n=1 Tax=Candidatus Nitrosarchaeum limnium SFB1 TaxID=886738 RepID=F3KJY1_9ARCH|nr:Hypothetical protein Nlim_0790 [Candidatus Nitrosarchaeum limnium SFB1]
MIFQIPADGDFFQIEFTGPQFRDISYDAETGETFKIILEPDSTEDIKIKIPNSFPIKSKMLNGKIYYGEPIAIGNDLELPMKSTDDKCFTYYTITHDNYQRVGIWHTVILSGDIVFVGKQTPENCAGKIKTPYDSPYMQIRSGIYRSTIACNEGLELYLQYDDRAVCLNSSTTDTLLKRGWFTSDPPPCPVDCKCNWIYGSFHDFGTPKQMSYQAACP